MCSSDSDDDDDDGGFAMTTCEEEEDKDITSVSEHNHNTINFMCEVWRP
jgi:hypothetical protein